MTPFNNREHRHAAILAVAGGVCCVVATLDGGVVFGTNPLTLAAFLVLVGLMYLVFALLTYVSPPTTVHKAVFGALSASGLAFSMGTAGMYYEMAVISSFPATTALFADALAYSAVGTLLTLPVSGGWVAGTLINLDRPLSAVVGIAVVTVISGLSAATLLITLQSFSGAAAGFAQVASYIAVIGAAGLAYLPFRATVQPREDTSLRDE